jgi:hypothetical protein
MPLSEGKRIFEVAHHGTVLIPSRLRDVYNYIGPVLALKHRAA